MIKFYNEVNIINNNLKVLYYTKMTINYIRNMSKYSFDYREQYLYNTIKTYLELMPCSYHSSEKMAYYKSKFSYINTIKYLIEEYVNVNSENYMNLLYDFEESNIIGDYMYKCELFAYISDAVLKKYFKDSDIIFDIAYLDDVMYYNDNIEHPEMFANVKKYINDIMTIDKEEFTSEKEYTEYKDANLNDEGIINDFILHENCGEIVIFSFKGKNTKNVSIDLINKFIEEINENDDSYFDSIKTFYIYENKVKDVDVGINYENSINYENNYPNIHSIGITGSQLKCINKETIDNFINLIKIYKG